MATDKNRGFILLYVAGLLAAIGVILLEIGRMQSPSPLFMEKQLSHELQLREEQLLLDFVIAGTKAQDLQIDPRYMQFKRIVAAMPRASSEAEEQLAMLKALLDQANFKIDGSSSKEKETGKGVAVAETKEQAAAREGKDVVLFTPGKTSYKLQMGEMTYEVRILPANALPNLNSIPFDSLWRYLVVLKIPEAEAKDLAAALIDWRDPDDLLTDGRGAESGYYYGMRPAYSARNAPIRTWQELNYVRGMTPERVWLLRDKFMLGSAEITGISPDYASPETFVAMTGLSLETVTTILKAYGKLDDKRADIGDILLSQDTAAFDRVASWKIDTSMLRIQITSPASTLTADYDAKKKRVIAWW